MFKFFLAAFLISASTTVSFAQEADKIHPPKLTPQQSGTTQLRGSRNGEAEGNGHGRGDDNEGDHEHDRTVVITTETEPNFTSGEAA
jgi:hypothetical protein